MTESLKPEFKVYHADAHFVFGANPTLELLLENDTYPFAHEAGVFIPSQNALYITSNQHKDQLTRRPKITICRIDLSIGNESVQATFTEVRTDNISMPNGGVNYKDGILFCAQGTLTAPSGLAYMPLNAPCDSKLGHLFHPSTLLLTSFHGRPFNSPNDVVVHSDGSIWFTDPIYGWEQGIRPRPRLPNQVYRFDPETGDVRAMADGFGRPNGICFSPDERTCYVTDTDWIHGDGSREDTRVSSIYAFNVDTYNSQPFLTTRRLFAMADTGIPDGIKCDVFGNVYSGCGDGISIWSAGGVLLGKILVDGGVANFCFGREGTLYLLNETRVWRARIKPYCKGALLRL